MIHGGGFAVALRRVTRERFALRLVTPIQIYDCAGARDPAIEQKLRELLRNPMLLLRAKTLRRGAHDPAPSCALHAEAFCISTEAT